GAAAWYVTSDGYEYAPGGSESLIRYAGQMAVVIALTGGIIGWRGKKPEWVGAVAGAVITVLSIPIFTSPTWVLVGLIACLPSGLVCGLLTGFAMRLLRLAK